MPPQRKPISERFWSKVEKTDTCWNWTAAKHLFGYGKIDNRDAHRVSYEMAYGPVPAGMCVLHHCDNPPYVRPDHLHLGTRKDNYREMRERGRSGYYGSPGAKNPKAKLTDDQVREIRELYKTGLSQQKIADRFGVVQTIVSRIVLRQLWAHVA